MNVRNSLVMVSLEGNGKELGLVVLLVVVVLVVVLGESRF
jgi:hypothetical protein